VELRNIIDKLAQFVARNGPEFEQMTKNKQKGNPKFGFLFGGEHFNYYQYKVTTEQASKYNHYFLYACFKVSTALNLVGHFGPMTIILNYNCTAIFFQTQGSEYVCFII
jgi:hypothetical protein